MKNITVDVNFQDQNIENQLVEYKDLMAKTISKSIEMTQFKHSLPIEISLNFIDNKQIAELNHKYRNINKPTNVLSFPVIVDFDDYPHYDFLHLGDIIISLEYIQNEAKLSCKEFKKHLQHMLIHGCLHLLGFDHINEKEAIEMEKLEIEILHYFGVESPYGID